MWFRAQAADRRALRHAPPDGRGGVVLLDPLRPDRAAGFAQV